MMAVTLLRSQLIALTKNLFIVYNKYGVRHRFLFRYRFSLTMQRYGTSPTVYSAFDTLQKKVIVIVFIIVENSVFFAKIPHQNPDVKSRYLT
jgi:hypothetical protein